MRSRKIKIEEKEMRVRSSGRMRRKEKRSKRRKKLMTKGSTKWWRSVNKREDEREKEKSGSNKYRRMRGLHENEELYRKER